MKLKMKTLKEQASEILSISQNNILNKNTLFEVNEAYKATRTNLMFSLSKERNCKKIIVASGVPGEGKTTTCLNIAISFAQTGVKVLVLDADLRKPRIHKYLNLENKNGLSNVLGGFYGIEECIQRNVRGNLDVVTAGHIPPNPAELLASDEMKTVMERLDHEYDYIFIDTPPINVVTDASIISKLVTGVVLVVRNKYSRHEVVRKALATLKFVDAKVLGFILNATKFNANYNKGYRYKKYGYGYGKLR